MNSAYQQTILLFRKAGAFAALTGFVLSVSNCSETGGPSADIAIGISPSKVFIVPGTGSSCVAYAAAKTQATEVVTRDLSADRAYFQNFSLQWRSPDALTISELVVEMTGSALTAEDGQKLAFSEDEIRALTGLSDLTIEQDDNRSSKVPFNLDSNSTQRKGPADRYAPCGLHIAGITTDPDSTSGGVSIKVTLRGYSTDKAGNQKPIRQSTTVRAEKL